MNMSMIYLLALPVLMASFFFVIAERLTSATGADLVQLLFIAGKYQNNLKMHL